MGEGATLSADRGREIAGTPHRPRDTIAKFGVGPRRGGPGLRLRHAHAYPRAYPYSYPHSYAHPYSHAYADSYPYPYADAYPHSYSYPYAHLHPHA